VPAALDAWESSQYRTDRAVDSLYATAEEVLHVYANERVSASTDGHDLDLEHFLRSYGRKLWMSLSHENAAYLPP
jgi:hypothetical protein